MRAKEKRKGHFRSEPWLMISPIIVFVIVLMIGAFCAHNRSIIHSSKLRKVYADLETIMEVVNDYNKSNGIYPKFLDDIKLDCIKDRYSMIGENYIYRVLNDKIILYSR